MQTYFDCPFNHITAKELLLIIPAHICPISAISPQSSLVHDVVRYSTRLVMSTAPISLISKTNLSKVYAILKWQFKILGRQI